MCISASPNRDALFLCPDFIGGIPIRKRNNRVVVHLNDAELSKLEQDSATAGMCREKYIRLALMGITIHPRPPDNYGKVLQQLSAYGNNLNQIAHVVNATGRATAEQLDTALQILEKTWDYVEDTQKHGFYYVVLNLPTDEKGKRNRKTLSTGLSTDRNATKAKALLQTMIRAASAGEEVHGVKERVAAAATEDTEESWNTPHPNMLFSNYLEFWLQWKRKSWEEVTYSGYCQNVRSWIAPYFSARKVRLNEITVLDIEMFYTHEINKRGVSGNTVLHYHANIRKALSDAVKLKLIPYNPAAEVERPKKDNFVASYYSADELMEVLPIFANTKMELPVMLAAFYGLRRSEVIGLQWSAIDFERKIVTISRTFERINVDGKMVDVSKCRTKNKSSFRSLPLIPAVEQALLKAQKRQRQQMKLCGNSYCKEYKDYICVDDMGHLVTPDYVTRVFREMLLKNGFRPIRYHDLRHSCASLLIKNKVMMKEVQMWLGHSSFSTTANIYAHIDVDSKMEAANMIASKINLGELPEKKKSPKRKIA